MYRHSADRLIDKDVNRLKRVLRATLMFHRADYDEAEYQRASALTEMEKESYIASE